MYRKYYKNDELISNVIITFALFVMFAIIFYVIYYETGGFTPSSILYLSLTGLSLLLSMYNFVVYLISLRRPIQDYSIDLENECIAFSKRRKVLFQAIKLYAVRKNRSEIKIYYGISILNIISFQLHDDTNKELPLESSKQIGKYAVNINHRHLYNYNFLSVFTALSLNLIYLFIQDRFLFLDRTYHYLIVFGVTVLLSILLVTANVIRLNILFQKGYKKD